MSEIRSLGVTVTGIICQIVCFSMWHPNSLESRTDLVERKYFVNSIKVMGPFKKISL